MGNLNKVIKEYRVSKPEKNGSKSRTRPYVDFICGNCGNTVTLPKSNYKDDKYCNKCIRHEKAKQRFFVKAKEKFGDKYDLSKVSYISPTTKVEVICSKHKISHWITPTRFLVKKYTHIKGHSANGGCPKCAEEVNKTKNQKSINYYLRILADRFPQFSVVSVKNEVESVNDKITLYCKQHGEFTKTLHSIVSKESVHLCPHCNNDLNAWKMRTTRTDAKGKVYFVYLPDIQMFKFGVTYRDIKRRMYELGNNIELIWSIEFNTLADAYFFEYQFFRHYKSLRYKGDRLINKGGYTELMTTLIEKPTKCFVEEILRRKESNSGEPQTDNAVGNPERSL